MNCEACGHEWHIHDIWEGNTQPGLCYGCFKEPHGGPCFPWEFR